MPVEKWVVYLSGEIHTNWREIIISTCREQNLPFTFLYPVLDHAQSDDCGALILGDEQKEFWRDHKAAKINAIRTRGFIQKSDIVVVRFGDKFRQWNAAFDAGYASALGKSVITLHDADLDHALKEVDAIALASAQKPEQVVGILNYIMS